MILWVVVHADLAVVAVLALGVGREAVVAQSVKAQVLALQCMRTIGSVILVLVMPL